jgi:hypothetical protein
MHLYLINHKVEVLNAFNMYKVEVEKQNKRKLRLKDLTEADSIMIGT